MMKFRFAHNCVYVADLERSLKFYEEALGLKPVRTMHPSDMDATLVFVSDGESAHQLEIAYVPARTTPYTQGDNTFHVAFSCEDMEKAHALHEKMGCIVRDPETEPVYFIQDPDGYQIEIIPA
jgi:lactoylglutathione lyase